MNKGFYLSILKHWEMVAVTEIYMGGTINCLVIHIEHQKVISVGSTASILLDSCVVWASIFDIMGTQLAE